jgi:hypothetical protein
MPIFLDFQQSDITQHRYDLPFCGCFPVVGNAGTLLEAVSPLFRLSTPMRHKHLLANPEILVRTLLCSSRLSSGVPFEQLCRDQRGASNICPNMHHLLPTGRSSAFQSRSPRLQVPLSSRPLDGCSDRCRSGVVPRSPPSSIPIFSKKAC